MGNIEKFDFIANQYDTSERMEISKIISDAIRMQVIHANEKQAIDFGCGTGLIGLNLLDVFHSVLFIDASQNMVEVVKNKLEKMQIQNANALCCDLEADQPEALHADYIILAQVLLHIKDIHMILSRLYSALNKGGHLVIVDFDKNESVVSDEVHNGFEQHKLLEMIKGLGFEKGDAKTFYHGNRIFMNQDASLFILDAVK